MRILPPSDHRRLVARFGGSVVPAALAAFATVAVFPATLAVLTALVAATASTLTAQTVSIGNASDALRTVDGCHRGRIVAPLVPIWDRHPGDEEPARRIGYLRGTHRRSLCDGTVVRVHERARRNGRVYVRVEPVVGPGPGWISEGFLGSYFPRWRCDWRFEGEARERCREI